MDPATAADVVAVDPGSPARSTSSSLDVVGGPPKVRRTNIQVCVRVRPLHVDNGDPRTAANAGGGGGGSPARRRLRRHPSSMSSSTTTARPPPPDDGGLPPPSSRSSPSGLQPPASSIGGIVPPGGADASGGGGGGGVKSRIRPPSRINKLSSRLRRPPSHAASSSSFGSSPGEPSPGGRLRVDEAASGPSALTESALRRLDDRAGGGGAGGGGPPSASSASNLAPTRFSSGPDAAPTRAALSAWECPPDNTTVRQTASSHPDPSRKSSYSFDRVYGPSSVTSGIYDESVRDVVESAMEGYHGSVFAYGQTSTGKTFTMTGTEKSPGVVPLAVRDCFGYIERGKNSDPHGREYLLRVSYMEIYNEQIHDLLAPSSSRASGAIRIFESKSEGVIVRGLKEEVVTCPQQVFALIAQGDARRSTGSTDLNRRSSRSHSIFRLLIESRSRGGSTNSGDPAFGGSYNGGGDPCGPVRVSSLSLVDLAGSESVKATNATGTRQKEGQFINKSLMTLGHVIWKLSEMSARAEAAAAANAAEDATAKPDVAFPAVHVPYRDSKLTRLLQPSLSGNAQICIVCNISPEMRNLDESHNTLKFASRAKRIKQNAVVTEVVDDKTLLQNYREEIEALKRQLTEAKEAQRALMEERSHASGSIEEEKKASERAAWASSARSEEEEEDDDEDAQALVVAIQNLEKLILKNSGGGGNAASSDRNGAKDVGTNGGVGKGGGGESQKDGRHAGGAGGGEGKGPNDPNDSLFSLASNFDALLLDDDDGGGADGAKSSSKAVAASSAGATPAASRAAVPSPLDLFDDDDDVAGGFGDADAALVSPAAAPRPTASDGGGGVGTGAEVPDPPSGGPSPKVAGESPFATGVGAFDFETPGRNVDNGGSGGGREEAESTLVSELHRIQGLLGSVLKRKARFTSDRPSSFSSSTSSPPRHGGHHHTASQETSAETPLIGTGTSSSSAFPPPPPSCSRIAERTPGRGGASSSKGRGSPFKKRVFQTPKRDQEVESLRRQLEEQEVASSLRKADSNFLQSQLAEKDGLLKEVSKILDAVEKRQVELESENARLKARLGRTAAELAARDAELVAFETRASLVGNDDDDGGMFDTLL